MIGDRLEVFGSDIGPIADWCSAEIAEGARLFLLEGMMGGGKTSLARSLAGVVSGLATVEYDKFLSELGHRHEWSEGYKFDSAERTIGAALSGSNAVIFEGATAWAAARAVVRDTPSRRIYLRPMQFPNGPLDALEIYVPPKRDVFLRSVNEYLREQLCEDAYHLVIERFPAP